VGSDVPEGVGGRVSAVVGGEEDEAAADGGVAEGCGEGEQGFWRADGGVGTVERGLGWIW